MVPDQGEFTVAIEHDSNGENPRIVGYALPQNNNNDLEKVFSKTGLRDSFLAAVDAYNTPLKYKNHKKHKKKKKPNDLLRAYVQGKLEFHQPESEAMLYKQAMLFKERCESDSEF